MKNPAYAIAAGKIMSPLQELVFEASYKTMKYKVPEAAKEAPLEQAQETEREYRYAYDEMLASLLQHDKVLTTENDENMNVETDVAPGIQAVVAEFVRRVYSGYDEMKVQTYCERHDLGALGLKHELCVGISLLLVDAPGARAEPAEGDN